jgi:hypothetical protein
LRLPKYSRVDKDIYAKVSVKLESVRRVISFQWDTFYPEEERPRER